VKKLIMYTVAIAAITAIVIIAIVGCNDNVGNSVGHLNEFLSSFGGGKNNNGTDTTNTPGDTNSTNHALHEVTIVLNNGSDAFRLGSYAKDSIVYINAGDPPAGHQFKEWTANTDISFYEKNNAATAFKMPGSAVTVTANFELKMYTLYVKIDGNGGVSVDGGAVLDSIQESYTYMTEVTLKAVPNDGNDFHRWMGSINNNGESLTVTMDGDKTLTAFFFIRGETPPLIVYFNGNHETSGRVPNSITDKKKGEIIMLPDSGTLKRDGFSFKGWTTDTLNTDNIYNAGQNYLLESDNDITFYAVWIPKTYKLTTNASTTPSGNGGYVSRDSNPQEYSYNAVVIVTAIENEGYTFTGWSGDVPTSFNNTDNTLIITMNSDKKLTANFVQQIKFTLTVNVGSGGGGTVEYSPQQTSYISGTTVNISAKPSNDYEFDSWTVTNGQGQTTTGKSKDTTITVNSNMTFTANFKEIYVPVTPPPPPTPPGPATPQTTQDYAKGNRLVINNKNVFISGMNIAWNNFGSDVGDVAVNINPFVNQFKQIKNAGGNAVRWWLHADFRNDPKMNSDGSVDRIGTKTIDNVRQVLDSAYSYGIVVSLCLFSFDLLNLDGKNASKVAINKKFLTVPANLDSYISKVLTPMLNAVGNHPAIMCWEVFNEPEGMSSDADGWTGEKVPMSDILRITARIAAVVHDKTLKMASTGIHEYGKMKTWYSDFKLITAAGSDPLASKAYLDFYMAHYYPEFIGTSGSPFHNPASFWGMDRPILIGEFPAQSWGPGTGYSNIQIGTDMTIIKAYEYAYDNGYCGALSWSMTEPNVSMYGNFNTTEPALKNLSNKHKADIDLGGNTVVIPTGDQVMKIALNGLPTSDPLAELSSKADNRNLSNNTNISFDIYIATGSNTNLTILPVIKAGNDWVWCPATDNAFSLAGKVTGQWITVTVPINKFVPEKGSLDKSAVKAIILQFQPTGSAYTGTIYIDNIRVDNTVIYNFDNMGDEWNATKWVGDANVPVPEATVSQAAKSSLNKRRW